MPVFKNEDNGTWYVMARYVNWKGERKQKCKRGFATKKEAQEWERMFQLQNASDLDMSFEAFTELYIRDVKTRLKENTWLTKEHIIRTKILPYFGKLKISEISVGIRYRYTIPRIRESQSQPLSLTPLEFRVGLLSMSSKSSVIDGGLLLSWPGGTEAAPSKSEKFNVVIENVKCVTSNEMVLRVLQESVRTVRDIEEIMMKMRMVRTCDRYQSSLLFYTLLGKVELIK